jgi:hypothetical protein
MIETLETRRLMTVTALADLSSVETPSDPAPVVVYGEAQLQPKLLAELISNIMKTRSEISMTYARNLRA